MKRIVLAALAASSFSCAALQSAGIKAPTVNVGAAGDLVEMKNKFSECEAFAEKPIAYPEEAAIGGAIALALGAKTHGGIYVEVAPELASLTDIPKGKYDKVKPAPGTGPKTDLTRYLNTLGKGLASYSERPTIEWVFGVLDSPTPNAFSAPGGYVFITTGMLKQVQNEAQLAGVLGHEIGHVTGKHALEAYKKSKKVSCLVSYFGGKLSDGAIRNILGPLVTEVERAAGELRGVDLGAVLKMPVFDPNKLTGPFVKWLTNKIVDSLIDGGYEGHEKDADATATRILVFSGYDVSEFEKVIAGLPEGGGSVVKHPSNKDRLAVIAEVKEENAGFGGPGKAPALSPTVAAAMK